MSISPTPQPLGADLLAQLRREDEIQSQKHQVVGWGQSGSGERQREDDRSRQFALQNVYGTLLGIGNLLRIYSHI